MLNYLKEESNITRTENGAAAYRTTYSSCLDLFSHIGALRSADDEAVISAFIKAYSENPDMAMKVLFFARDIREGLGERRVFRIILRWLAHSCPASVNKNVGLIAEFGRFDDLLCLLGTPCEMPQSPSSADSWMKTSAQQHAEQIFPCWQNGCLL